MKTAVKISRIVMCVIVSVYTVYLCINIGRTAYLKGQVMQMNPDGSFELVWSGINQEVVLYISVGLFILLLGVASAILMFKNGRIFAAVASVCAIACALLGIFLNTELSEYMFMKYQLGMLCTMWDPLHPGIKPVSPALAGGSFAAEPSGEL